MALKKALSQRILDISTQSFSKRKSSSDPGIFRRFLHREILPELRSLPAGNILMERLRGMDNARRERVRMDGLTPPAKQDLTVKKLMWAAQVASVKSRLRETDRSCVSYPEFLRICGEGCADPDQGSGIAKALDHSGSVIVLGNKVFLNPDQVVKSMEKVLELQLAGARASEDNRKELEEMEKVKLSIDREAESVVRGELWCGLGFLLVQTAGFMRLTFWELSWDVMEPICFYVTSFYFMIGYAFFLTTSREPSFEGFFHTRFSAKQKRLIKERNFDMDRYIHLRRACGFNSLKGPVFDGVTETVKFQH